MWAEPLTNKSRAKQGGQNHCYSRKR